MGVVSMVGLRAESAVKRDKKALTPRQYCLPIFKKVMLKRKNPFGDTAPIQLKTHVGFKQAATEADKREVYEKTRAMLFKGANPSLQELSDTNGASCVFSHPSQTNGSSLQGNGFHSNGTSHSQLSTNGSQSQSNGSPSHSVTDMSSTNVLHRYFSNGINKVAQNGHISDCRNGVSKPSELTHVPTTTLSWCKSCHRNNVRLVRVCVHCEGRLCGGDACLRKCCVCSLELCQFCTVLNYTEKDIRIFCFNCLPMVT